MPLEISGTLDDKYEILKRLATGGMGDVYLVRHKHLQEQRVVKVLRADMAGDADAMQRFRQEARVATSIKHPNVAILYDYSQLPDGRYYMVWEHIEGEDLASRLRKGPVAVDEAIDLAIQALRGLDAIHSAGVVHRDISPDNLMLTRDRRGRPLLKIIDLGLVKDLRPGAELELTQAGAFLGKFQYCSPEQAGYLKDEPLDHRSDLYSLAQVLYEMVTGLPPFESESQHGFVLKRLTEEPLPLRERNPQLQIPAALDAVIMRGLERHRDQRFPDATAFIHALVKVAEARKSTSTQELSAEEVRRALESTGRGPRPERAPSAAGTTAPAPPTPATAAQAAKPASRPAAGSSGAASTAPPAKGAKTASSILDPLERDALLARIDRAASRVQEGGQTLAQADAALREGRFEDARALVQKLKATQPPPRGTAELERRLAEAEEIARRRDKVVQAEQMLEKYLLDRQQTLAALALETLLDLYPNHPKRADYQSWIAGLADEAERQKRAERLYTDGQAAVARGDLNAARRLLSELERQDPSGKLVGSLLAEVNEEERSRAKGQQAAQAKQRLEEALRRGEISEADQVLDQLSALEVTKVTLDLLKGQVEEAKQRQARASATTDLERGFQDAVARHDWHTARELARAFEETAPDSPRPRQMMAEISRLQEAEQRQQAVAEGLRAFDGYLRGGQLAQAEVALRVLRQMGAGDPRVAEAEQRLQQARG